MISDFYYNTPTTLLFGKGVIKYLPELLNKYGATELMNTPDKPSAVHTFKMFNRVITRVEIYPRKKRYYFLGINIGTKHMD